MEKTPYYKLENWEQDWYWRHWSLSCNRILVVYLLAVLFIIAGSAHSEFQEFSFVYLVYSIAGASVGWLTATAVCTVGPEITRALIKWLQGY